MWISPQRVSPPRYGGLCLHDGLGDLVARGPIDQVDPVGREQLGVKARDQPLLDVFGAATHLGCSERFIRRLVQERRVPFVKLGGTKVRFLVSDLDRWVAGQRVEARR